MVNMAWTQACRSKTWPSGDESCRRQGGAPEAILIIWPLKPTVVEPGKLQATVAAIVKVLSSAQIEFAQKARGGL